jgi:hypothetical protein
MTTHLQALLLLGAGFTWAIYSLLLRRWRVPAVVQQKRRIGQEQAGERVRDVVHGSGTKAEAGRWGWERWRGGV